MELGKIHGAQFSCIYGIFHKTNIHFPTHFRRLRSGHVAHVSFSPGFRHGGSETLGICSATSRSETLQQIRFSWGLVNWRIPSRWTISSCSHGYQGFPVFFQKPLNFGPPWIALSDPRGDVRSCWVRGRHRWYGSNFLGITSVSLTSGSL